MNKCFLLVKSLVIVSVLGIICSNLVVNSFGTISGSPTAYRSNGYVNPLTGEFIVVGEIQNDSCRPINNVRIGVQFYDSNNNIIYDHFAPVSINQNKTTIVGELEIVNEKGEPIVEPIIGQKLLFPVELANQIDRKQNFAYFLQVKDEKGFTVHLSWITGVMQSNQVSTLEQEWIPETAGEYTVDIFIWSSEQDPIPLSIQYETTVIIKNEVV